jgi:hypothetical protein
MPGQGADNPFFFSFLFLFLEVWGMGQGFWKNGCTAPPFFEACPYTWKCKILQITWKLEISPFSNLDFSKFRLHLDPHIYCSDFCFMKN